MEEYLKCFDAWFENRVLYYIPFGVFEYQNSIQRAVRESGIVYRISIRYKLSVEEANEALYDFDKSLNKCFDKFMVNLAEDYANYKRLSVNLTTLRVVESGEFEQWAKYMNNIDKTDVKKFERYVRGEF